MKALKIFLLTALCYLASYGQNVVTSPLEKEKVVLDNEQFKVVEFESQPNGNVCGIGMHHHEPHLVITLSDVSALQTMEGQKSKPVAIMAGVTHWVEEETHAAVNAGDKPIKILVIYLKD